VSRGRGELVAADAERLREGRIGELREHVVTSRVKADGHPRLGERSNLGGTDPGVVRVRPESLSEPRGRGISVRGVHLLEPPTELVYAPCMPAAYAKHDRADVLQSGVDRALQSLVGERKRLVERGAAQEEARGDADPSKSGQGLGFVTREIVVERDGDREALPPPPGTRSLLQLRRGDHGEVPTEESNLPLEQSEPVRGHELPPGIPSVQRDAVVEERDARLATRRTH